MRNRNFALFQLGFRTFFFLGTLFSSILLSYWIFVQLGSGRWISERFWNPVFWHAHEMVFGFTGAIIAGFLLTASANWSGKKPLQGWPLVLLGIVWIIPRILPFLPFWNWILYSAFDLMFLPLLIVFLFPFIGSMQQKRNWIVLVILSLYYTGNVLFHLSYILQEPWSRKGYLLGLHSILVLMLLIGGRVIPFFTSRAVPNAKSKSFLWLELSSLILPLAFLALEVSIGSGIITAALAFGIFLTQFTRWILWRPWQSKSRPILWVLYTAYFWIILGFGLTGLSELGEFLPSQAIHSFTVGGIGILVYGMVSRVSLGHTGRPLKAAKGIVLGYYALNFAAFSRVLFPVFGIPYSISIYISGGLWIFSYLILFLKYTPYWMQPRPDAN